MTSREAAPTAGDDGPPGDDGPVHERMARLLARRMAAAGHAPRDTISVAELRGELLPYPLTRESLDLASKAEYDLALLRLLHDPAYLSIGDPGLAEAVEEELSGPEPGLAFLGEFTEAPLRPSGTAAEPPDAEPTGEPADDEPAGAEPSATEPANGAEADAAAGASGAGPAATGPADAASVRDPADAAFLSELAGEPPERDLAPSGSSVTCRSCGRSLPERADARFCPYCGSDQRSLRCEGCDTDLEAGWKYCPSCGRQAGPSGSA